MKISSRDSLRPPSTGDVLRWASSVVASDRNGAERRKAEAILRLLRDVGNGAGPVVLRHVGGVPWDALTLPEREAIIGTMAALRPALQAAGMMPCDPRPGDGDLPPDAEDSVGTPAPLSPRRDNLRTS